MRLVFHQVLPYNHDMVEIGRLNKLKVLKKVEFGVFLDGQEDGEILLPLRSAPESCEIDEEIEVFIYRDSEDRLVATTETPFAQLGEFASLRVKALEKVGAFLDWGLPKDLLLPFSEQTRDLCAGQYVLVYLYLDKSDRICASMRLDRHIDKTPGDYEEEQTVDLLIAAKTDLGFKAIVNGRHWGMLYSNEVFTHLEIGQRTKGIIKTIRPDGKIDLSLQKLGHKGSDDIGEKILALLKARGGFLEINDKTAAETIYQLFGVSKKKYKMALGGLYKKRLITIQDNGIKLN